MKRYLRHYLYSHSWSAQFLRFASVGAKISVVDAGVMYLLPWLVGMNIYLARIISLSMANIAGYFLNRYFTFAAHQKGPLFKQMAGHLGVHLTGGLINYGVFLAVVTFGRQYLVNGAALAFLPLIALWLGGMVGMSFNFCISKKLVFHPHAGKVKAI